MKNFLFFEKLRLQFFRTNDQANKENMLGEKKDLGVSCTLRNFDQAHYVVFLPSVSLLFFFYFVLFFLQKMRELSTSLAKL